MRRGTVSSITFLLLCLAGLHFCDARTVPLRSLRPLFVRNIGEIGEPSGLSFSNLTEHLYAISDTGSTNFIYELYTNGTMYQAWKIGKHHEDIEAVACDDKNKLIYIAEEENMRITSYQLPLEEDENWDSKHELRLVGEFVLDSYGGDPNSGLEGLCVDTLRDLLYATYEKKPKMMYTLDTEGNILDLVYPKFGGDLSGMFYDAVKDCLWIVSDQSKKVYVTDVTASEVYDYWSIPLTNGEGIAIDYVADPPLMYITTDPSNPSGPPYEPLLATFLLPEVGTGYKYPDVPWNPPDIPCVGCHTAYEDIMEEQDEFYALVRHQELIYSSELLAVMSLIFVPVLLVILFVVVRKIRNYDYKNFQDVAPVTNRNEPNPWDDLFSNMGDTKEQRPVAGRVSHHNFEDEQF